MDLEHRSRVVIESVSPAIDAGQFAIKRVAGERVRVEADAFTDGHDVVSVRLFHRHASSPAWTETPMAPLGNDRWAASFAVTAIGRYCYTVRAQIDRFATWARDTQAKARDGQDVSLEVAMGQEMLRRAARGLDARGPDAPGPVETDAEFLRMRAEALATVESPDDLSAWLADDRLAALMHALVDEASSTVYGRELPVVADVPKARFSTWYELFPRSFGPAAAPGEERRHGTFKDVQTQLPRIAGMGFDVLYLPPIHPVGATFRKGMNNAVTAAPGDVGSPWGIGGPEGGHKAVHPELGTLEDFRALVEAATGYGMDVALDIAFQCSPDHPYVKEHPEWFRHRPDGTIQYAENPPKKYQDIYPFDFENEDWRGLWEELRDVFLFWIGQGVMVFRVDNPHTKPFPFWEWLITTIKQDHPEVIFLAEAFTRPRVMYRLAKLGFTQSYTYFAWRNSKQELTDYLTELTQTPVYEFFRPNLWPNTPDILTEYLQAGGRPAFTARLVLAATLGASYGIYGLAFELLEHTPREHGSEEYLHSEKYELRQWELDRPGDLTELITQINAVRRDSPALQSNGSLRFHHVDNEHIICYSKRAGEDVVLVLVNLDPRWKQSAFTSLNLWHLGLVEDEPFEVHDLLSEQRYLWHGPRNYVELDPAVAQAHVFRLRAKLPAEHTFDPHA
ncbi:MAG: alpha-1,4-glucan--maltose-1-phosphate maltosyltransferase [Dehalococcoidia bacterium]